MRFKTSGGKYLCLFLSRRNSSIVSDRFDAILIPQLSQHCTGWWSAACVHSVLYLEYCRRILLILNMCKTIFIVLRRHYRNDYGFSIPMRLFCVLYALFMHGNSTVLTSMLAMQKSVNGEEGKFAFEFWESMCYFTHKWKMASAITKVGIDSVLCSDPSRKLSGVILVVWGISLYATTVKQSDWCCTNPTIHSWICTLLETFAWL